MSTTGIVLTTLGVVVGLNIIFALLRVGLAGPMRNLAQNLSATNAANDARLASARATEAAIANAAMSRSTGK